MRQKLPEKTGVVVAEMLVIGSASLYFIQQAYPDGGFVRDLLAVTITGLVSSAFSVTLEKTARREYLVMLTVIIALLLLTVCWVKLSLKETLATTFDAVKLSVVKAGTPITTDSCNKYNAELQQQWREYWKNY